MKLFRIIATLLLMAGAVSCMEDDDTMPDSQVTVAPGGVLLAGRSGAESSLRLAADTSWELIVPENSDFAVTPSSGAAGLHSVTVRALSENPERGNRSLGAIILAETNGSRRQIPVLQAPAVAEQSLFIVLSGTGNLSSFFTKNINETVTGIGDIALERGRVLIFRQENTDGYLLEARYNPVDRAGQLDTLRRYHEICSTEPAALSAIFSDMVGEAPARSYGLIMGSHATAWVPSSHLNLYSLRPAQDDYWTPGPGAELTRWYGADRQIAMDIDVLAQCIESAGVSFDYLIFDACFMSSIETLYALRHAAGRIVASPCEIMAYGFPYHRLMAALFDSEAHYDLTACCKAFYDYYATTSTTRKSGCTALTLCDRLEDLADVVARINRTKLNPCDADALQSYEG